MARSRFHQKQRQLGGFGLGFGARVPIRLLKGVRAVLGGRVESMTYRHTVVEQQGAGGRVSGSGSRVKKRRMVPGMTHVRVGAVQQQQTQQGRGAVTTLGRRLSVKRKREETKKSEKCCTEYVDRARKSGVKLYWPMEL